MGDDDNDDDNDDDDDEDNDDDDDDHDDDDDDMINNDCLIIAYLREVEWLVLKKNKEVSQVSPNRAVVICSSKHFYV